MDSPLLLFGSLSLFHIIGATVLAKGLRGLVDGLREGETGGCRSLFTMVWAVMFGGIPFLFGIQFARGEDGSFLLLLGEVLVWTAAFLVSLLAPRAVRRALEPFLSKEILLMLFGGVFLLAGVTVMSLLTRTDRAAGLLTGGVFALVGAGVVALGLWQLFKSTR